MVGQCGDGSQRLERNSTGHSRLVESCDGSQCPPTAVSYISPITGPRFPEGYRKLRFPDYVTMAQDGGKVVSLTHWPFFTPRKYSWYSFLLEAESTPRP